MTTQNKLLALGAPLLVVVLYLGLRQPKIEEPLPPPQSSSETPVVAKTASKPAFSGPRGASSANPDNAQFIEQLRARYGAKINNPYVQVKLIEALMRHFQKTDFLHWREELLRAVKAAFPDHYEQIEKNLDRRLEYEKWVKENRTTLDALDPEARRAALREQREKLFGKDAADEIWASENKNQAVNDTLKEIDALEGKSIGEKVTTYTERLEEIYEEKYDTYLEQHRHEVLNRFLSLDSVQADLTAMSSEERTTALRDIRKGMGLDDAALQRWDTLDKTRDERWAQGQKYMAERTALLAAHSGSALEEKLAELRQRYFGTDAEVIAAEETSGLYRFGGPRKWGQN